MGQAAAKYLARYGAEELQYLAPLFADPQVKELRWQNVLAIPVFAETLDDLLAVTSELSDSEQNFLQIWVFNANVVATDEQVTATRQCMLAVKQMAGRIIEAGTLALCRLKATWILVVDRCSPGNQLKAKQGVGIARKIAGDLALEVQSLGFITGSWLAYTDADARLPEDYWQRVETVPANVAGFVFPNIHLPEGSQMQRALINQYQQWLDAYVEGLKSAGSPYAFHTIGSTMGCSLEHYARVRGIPDRLAGEDFYFLNKLAKTGQIHRLAGAPIRLSGRLSDRVPFGTGPALTKAITNREMQGVITGYHPLSYQLLALLLTGVENIWSDGKSRIVTNLDAIGAAMDNLLIKENIDFPESSGAYFESVKMALMLAGFMAKSKTKESFVRHFHHWFDAFRTLKFIHWWRDHGLQEIPVDGLN